MCETKRTHPPGQLLVRGLEGQIAPVQLGIGSGQSEERNVRLQLRTADECVVGTVVTEWVFRGQGVQGGRKELEIKRTLECIQSIY